MKYEMIIFDIDGTLCDTIDITYDCIKKVLYRSNIKYEVSKDIIKASMGKNFSDFACNCMPHLDKDLREKILCESDILKFAYLKKNGIKSYDNVFEIIKQLSKEYKIGIISNCNNEYIDIIIDKLMLKEYICDSIAASSYNISKAEAMKQMKKNNAVKNIIYVGDTMGDYNATIEAQIDFIFASYGFGKVNFKYKISNFNEIPVIIRKFESYKS